MQRFYFHNYSHDDNRVGAEHLEVKLPRICAHCNQTGSQQPLTAAASFSKNGEIYDSFAISYCMFCGHLTIHYVETTLQKDINGKITFDVTESIPKQKFLSEKLSLEIKRDFKDFSEIYTQALDAEKAGLDKVAGMGLRKAMEFLVIDFLLQYPVDGVEEQWLKSQKVPLKQKIEKIPNERTRDVAKAIAYLGNDETHYTRQHPEHDIDSIKYFIWSLIHDIESEIIHQKALTIIEKPKNIGN